MHTNREEYVEINLGILSAKGIGRLLKVLEQVQSLQPIMRSLLMIGCLLFVGAKMLRKHNGFYKTTWSQSVV